MPTLISLCKVNTIFLHYTIFLQKNWQYKKSKFNALVQYTS